MVGGVFLPRALEGHQTVLFVTFPPSSSLSQSPPACSCPARSTTHPAPLFWLPAPPDCLVVYFVSFCVSFSVLSLSLQVSVAGRSPFRFQRLQCKFPFPLGNALPCFGGFWGVFRFSVFFCLFVFLCLFFSFLFGGNRRKWEQGGGRWILFIFLAHFQGVGVFF